MGAPVAPLPQIGTWERQRETLACVPSPAARPSRRASWSVPVEETLDSLISVQETLFITVLSHRATPRTAAQVGLGVRRGADREEPVRVGPGAVWPQL